MRAPEKSEAGWHPDAGLDPGSNEPPQTYQDRRIVEFDIALYQCAHRVYVKPHTLPMKGTRMQFLIHVTWTSENMNQLAGDIVKYCG